MTPFFMTHVTAAVISRSPWSRLPLRSWKAWIVLKPAPENHMIQSSAWLPTQGMVPP